MSKRQFIYECDEATLKQLHSLTRGQPVFRKEFQQIVTNLINKASARSNKKLWEIKTRRKFIQNISRN